MEKKLIQTAEERLLLAREEGLNRNIEGSLRPLGKLWGMDVFMWTNPYPGVLANTIHSFPFPVIWIGNSRDILTALDEDSSLCSNLNAVIVKDNSIFGLKASWVNEIRNCAGTNSTSEAIEILKVFKASQKVLLYTSSGENTAEQNREFENYVKMVQAK